MKTMRILLGVIVASLLLTTALAQVVSVTESLHNLSPQGPGPVKATTGYACLFCHAPHRAMGAPTPLWNHQLSTQTYDMYTSTTYHQNSLQPQLGSSSKLCLSCHDGTVAIGQTVSQGLIATSGTMVPKSNLGTDLRTSHPFSFATPIVDNGELRLSLLASPAQTADPAVKLVQGTVECTTCHDPHTPNIDLVVPEFLVRDSSSGKLCLACHDPSRPTATYLAGWATSQHAIASNSTGGDPTMGGYATVAADACVSCHAPHNASSAGRLLRQATQEATCAACHNGKNLNPVLPDVTGEFDNSQYKHPINLTGLHDPAENAFPLNSSRHSECADCHNPHAAQAGTPATPPALQPALIGVSGVLATDGTTPLKPASNQYELCFKCHANSTNKPQSAGYIAYGRTPFRKSFSTVSDPYNARLSFQSPLTRHNVTQPSRAGIAPSLRGSMLDLSGNPVGRSMASGTYIYCTDCHNNDGARSSGGSAASGPHGSKYPHILERRYDLTGLPSAPGGDFGAGIAYSSGVTGPYALCDKCHNVDALVNSTGVGDTVFKKHWRHVVSVGASCSTCHASHGVQGGSTATNGHLVDFDVSVVGADSQNRLSIDTTSRTCYLTCHGVIHDGVTAPNTY
jgi:predicted CXXCH cytochrome family protein